MNTARIAILMATYNGEKFLVPQLESIKLQTDSNWHLYVLDDGSKDNTWKILQNFQTEVGREKVTLMQQHNQGAAQTFLNLINDNMIQADYYAYADQDDIWDQDKLQRALQWLSQQNNREPTLYCANVRLMDKNGKISQQLPVKQKDLNFKNALVQWLSPGNTMVFNHAVREILLAAGKIELNSMHDWWTYLIVTACGGKVYYDAVPVMSYRQHDNNVIGFSNSYPVRFKRALQRLLGGDFKNINDAHLAALNKIDNILTPEAKKVLADFKQARSGNVMKRLWFLHKSGVYRQERVETLGLYVAAVMGKL